VTLLPQGLCTGSFLFLEHFPQRPGEQLPSLLSSLCSNSILLRRPTLFTIATIYIRFIYYVFKNNAPPPPFNLLACSMKIYVCSI
jgi:hypothetical protein